MKRQIMALATAGAVIAFSAPVCMGMMIIRHKVRDYGSLAPNVRRPLQSAKARSSDLDGSIRTPQLLR